jgi:hypothetical protein
MDRLSTEEIQYGIDRCRARLAGIMPMDYITKDRVKKAMYEYSKELERRGVKQLEFSYPNS